MADVLYYDNLYDIVFHRHELLLCDELIVISGYVGPAPVHRVKDIPLKTTVVYGMYASDGIHKSLHNSLLKEEKELSNLKVLCSTMPVHTKAYMWLKDGKVIHSLIGSANFSLNGLTTPYKETLAETTVDTFKPLEDYIELVIGKCIPCADASVRLTAQQKQKQDTTAVYDPDICELPLYLLENGNKVLPAASGINWGMAKLTGSHVNINDAYIPIPAESADQYPQMFPAKQTAPVNMANVFREGHRHNDTVEVIWDDGTEMTVLLEGSRGRNDDNGNKVWYPKQIASSPRKAELGKYIRNRMEIPEGHAITYDDLTKYGRDTISISLQGEGIYYFDFAPKAVTIPEKQKVVSYTSVPVSPISVVAESASEYGAEKPSEKETVSADTSFRKVSAGDLVKHKSYGDGTVKEINGRILIATFNGVDRKFKYPDSFEKGFLSKNCEEHPRL